MNDLIDGLNKETSRNVLDLYATAFTYSRCSLWAFTCEKQADFKKGVAPAAPGLNVMYGDAEVECVGEWKTIQT
jgi:hypothetical protein